MQCTSRIVNSWNEWDPLEEVVVGCADNACFEPSEPGCRPQLRSGSASGRSFPKGSKPQESIDKANEELAALVRLLQSHGVTVRRPEPQQFAQPVRTPTFEIENQYCAVCPRDVLITLGNEIVEATMSRRARYFEVLSYRKLLYRYWTEDPHMIWTVAPKPSMADSMYRDAFWDWTIEERHRRMHAFEFCITQEEVVFDAADISRFGRDIAVQESMTTNRNGIRWLKRHLEPQGFRVHAVHFPLDLFPSHIDCTFVPLRPGLILTNPERRMRDGEENMFLESDWELIEAPQPASANDEMPEFCQCSKWLSMNVLSLSPKKIVCEQRETRLQEFLDRLGFEVLPLPFRNVFEYGGSFHCATWDVRRSGTCEDYFPRLQYQPLV